MPKLKGTTVSLAVDVSDTMKKCTISNALILLKLMKKKLSFRGNAYFKAVSWTKLLNRLSCLNTSNLLYHDMIILC